MFVYNSDTTSSFFWYRLIYFERLQVPPTWTFWAEIFQILNLFGDGLEISFHHLELAWIERISELWEVFFLGKIL